MFCVVFAGNRKSANTTGLYSIPGVPKSRSDFAGSITVNADVHDGHYSSVGRGTRFNRDTFSSGDRSRNVRSVVHSQPF